jgi:hypothetical protein
MRPYNCILRFKIQFLLFFNYFVPLHFFKLYIILWCETIKVLHQLAYVVGWHQSTSLLLGHVAFLIQACHNIQVLVYFNLEIIA